MTTLIVTIHILVCIGVIILVLLQSGKEGMGVIFGGGSQSVFGSSGAGGLLVKLTAIFGAIFLVTSLAYNVLSGADRRGSSSVMTGVQMEEPAVPPAAAPGGDAAKAGDKDKGAVKFEETAPPAAEPGKEKPAGQ